MEHPSPLKLIQILFTVGCVAVCIAALVRYSHPRTPLQVAASTTPATNTTRQSQPSHKDPPGLKTRTNPGPMSKQERPVERPTPPPATDAETPLVPPVRQTNYEITPVNPQSGDHDGYTFSIRQCIRSGDAIGCWGIITNVTDSLAAISFNDTRAVDDEGNSFLLLPIGFKGSGWSAHLIPNLP